LLITLDNVFIKKISIGEIGERKREREREREREKQRERRIKNRLLYFLHNAKLIFYLHLITTIMLEEIIKK